MRSYTVLVVVIIVIAGLGLYVYYENQSDQNKVNGSHVYLGAVYSGQAKSTNSISADVYFSSGPNLRENIYYVVLSVWDSNQSYDQIGISSLYGKFYSTYSYTEIVNGSIKYIFDPHWVSIVPGNHKLSMNVSQGKVEFRFDNSIFTAYTGGDYFSVETNERVGNHTFSGLTVYEEIYGFNKTLPGIAFNFSDLSYGTTGYPTGSLSNWASFSHNLTSNFTSLVFMKSNTVNIYNTPPLSLTLNVKNLQSSGQLIVSDVNLTIPGNGQYIFYLLPGNYTIYLEYSGQVVSYEIQLATDTAYTVTP